MRKKGKEKGSFGIVFVLAVLLLVAGCATAPLTQPAYMQPTIYQGVPGSKVFIKYNNTTPINFNYLPQTVNAVVAKGYTVVGSEQQADITLNLNYSLFKQENSQKQAQNAALGSLFGAALGVAVAALITGDAGDMGAGALGGGVAGAIEGASQDATSPYIDISVTILDKDGNRGFGQNIINIENFGSYQEIQAYIDSQTANLIGQILY